MKRLSTSFLFMFFALVVDAQTRIVSVPDDGTKEYQRVGEPELADVLRFYIKSYSTPIYIEFKPGSRVIVYEKHPRGTNKILAKGTWTPTSQGYEATIYDNSKKEYRLLLDKYHRIAYHNLFGLNRRDRYTSIKSSSDVNGLKFYRQTPYGYANSDLYIKLDGNDVAVRSLPQYQVDSIMQDPSIKNQLFKKEMPINLTKRFSISEIKSENTKPFEIGLFGVTDYRKINYSHNDYDFTSIINKFKLQGKSSEMVLNTIITPELGFSDESAAFLKTKIDSLKNIIDPRTSECKRFVITAKLDTINLNRKSSGDVIFEGNISLYIADIVTKKIFSKYTLCNIVGHGSNPDVAIKNSLCELSNKHSDISLFIKRGFENINIHYTNIFAQDLGDIVSQFIPLRRIGFEETDKSFQSIEDSFDKAVEFLLSTPKDHDEYSTSLKYAAFVSYVKSEYHYRFLLKKISKLVGWSQDQAENKQNNNKALSLLKEIPKESIFYSEAEQFKKAARRNLMSEKEQLAELMKKGEEAHNSLLNKVPKGKKTNIPGDTASGIFCLGVLLLAASVAAPISAPVSAILIIL